MTDYRNQFLLFSDILSGENVFRLLTIHKYFNTFYFRASEMCLKTEISNEATNTMQEHTPLEQLRALP